MSVEAEPNTAGDDWPVRPPDTGWSWKKTGMLIALAFAAHLAFLYVFGARKMPARRVPTEVPQFQLAGGDPRLIALNDPTLFAVPHVVDFVPAVWRHMPVVPPPSFHWPEPPAFLLPQVETLGAFFNEFMQTNRFARIQLNFKPEPKISAPIVPTVSLLPDQSTLRITGDLANRRVIASVAVPTLSLNDVIAPSRVQVLVDTSGRVVSDVLLVSSGDTKADQTALELARAIRFVPADQLMFGNLIFVWHTIPEPVASTNAPPAAP